MLLELFIAGGIATAPIDTTAIQIFEEHKIELVIPTPEPEPVITPQEQLKINIDTNVNNCDESLYWISAENATCLAKPVYTPKTVLRTSNTIRNVSKSRSGSPPLSWWGNGQCTQWVASQRSVGHWNNARSWTWQAQRDGWSTGSTPVAGAIGQKNNHVVYVESVNSNGTFNLSEMNYQSVGVITYRTVSSSGWNFIY